MVVFSFFPWSHEVWCFFPLKKFPLKRFNEIKSGNGRYHGIIWNNTMGIIWTLWSKQITGWYGFYQHCIWFWRDNMFFYYYQLYCFIWWDNLQLAENSGVFLDDFPHLIPIIRYFRHKARSQHISSRSRCYISLLYHYCILSLNPNYIRIVHLISQLYPNESLLFFVGYRQITIFVLILYDLWIPPVNFQQVPKNWAVFKTCVGWWLVRG